MGERGLDTGGRGLKRTSVRGRGRGRVRVGVGMC